MRFYDFLEGVQSRRMVCSRVGGCAVASEGVQQFGGGAAIRCSILGGVQYFGGGCAAFWRVCSILEGVQ